MFGLLRAEGSELAIMKVVAVAQHKGGTGKTTSALALAAIASQAGLRSLLIDLDPQACATRGVGVELSAEDSRGTIEDVLLRRMSLDAVILGTKFENLSVAPSSMTLAGALEDPRKMGRETRLAHGLKTIADRYDVVVIDTPPSLGILTTNALAACRRVIVPVEPQLWSVGGVARILEMISDVRSSLDVSPRLGGILITRVNPDYVGQHELMDEIRRLYRARVFKTVIPENEWIKWATRDGIPLPYYRECPATDAYRRVFREIFPGWAPRIKAG